MIVHLLGTNQLRVSSNWISFTLLGIQPSSSSIAGTSTHFQCNDRARWFAAKPLIVVAAPESTGRSLLASRQPPHR